MFRRGLAILLCSAMLVGSLPETSFAAENVETTETTETVEAETQENGDSPETGEDAPTSKAAVSETLTVAEPETKETEKPEAEKTETKAAEGNEDASEDIKETVAQETEQKETETKEAEQKEAETTTNPTQEQIVTETTMETEETAIVEAEEESVEEMTEEETIEEVSAEEIENAAEQDDETLGNAYITVSNVKVTYNSISFDYQKNNDYYIYYVYVGKTGQYIYSRDGHVEFNGLNPETEYEISFCGYSIKEKYYSFSRTTAECPYNVTYALSSTKADTIHITAEITAKEGAECELPDRFYLNWNCFDKDGNFLFESGCYYPVSQGDSLPITITDDIKEELYIFENTTYTFDVWIGELNPYGDDSQFAKQSDKTVTTPASVISNMGIEFKQNEPASSTVAYTLTTGDYKDSVDGKIYFRLEGSNESWDYAYYDDFHTENGSATGTIDELGIGSTYAYLIIAEGFKKEGTFKNGEAKLKWNMSHDVGAIDDIITFQIDEATKTQGAEYEVYGSYREYISRYSDDYEIYKEDDSKNIYRARDMHPNTKYEIKFTIWEYLPDGSENKYTAFDTVTTKASAVQTNIIGTYLDGVRYKVAFDSSVRTYEDMDIYVQPYVKNQDGKYTLLEDADEIYLTNDIDEESYYIEGLESNKTYEIFFGYMDDEDIFYEYGTMTFKTPADDRTITIDTPEVGISSFKIKGTFKGSTFPSSMETPIVLLCKESDSDKWEFMDDIYIYIYDEDEEQQTQQTVERKFTITAYDLKPDKSYDYAVGIEGNEFSYRNPDINKLKEVKKGTVKLNADERSVEITDTISLLDGIEIRAKLLGTYIDQYNEAYMYYREKGKTDASWDILDLYFSSGEGTDGRETYSVIRRYNGEALKSGTTFEYKLCMEGKVPEKEEDIAALAGGGEFTYTQPADDRALNVQVTASRTRARFVMTLTGSSRAEDNWIFVFYREQGSENWQYSSNWISNRSTTTTVDTTISWLNSETTYEYVVGISNGYISSPDDIVTGKQTGTFTTKDERKLGTPVITTGYTYADIEVQVDGLTTDDYSAYVRLFTKDVMQPDANWDSEGSTYVYNYRNTAQFSISALEQGKTYSYALVISEDYINPDSEEFSKLPESRKLVGTFTTNKSEYTLEITEDEKSVFNKEILNIKASASEFKEKNFDVVLYVRESETSDLVHSETISLDSVDHTAEAVITRISEKTQYTVSATLRALSVRNGSIIREVVATKEISFTTKAAAAPTELKTDVDEIYLNSWNPYYQSYWRDVIKITVPEGASDEVIWTSSNPNIADVWGNGIVDAGIPGDAEITAVSVLNPSVKTTVKVHVKNYGVVFTDTKTPSLYNSVYTLKNTSSANIAYAFISDDGTSYTEVKATATSDDPNIAYWDENNQCVIAKNVGWTRIILDSEGYKTDLYVTVYADSPDFDLKVSPTEESASYPALKKGDSYQIAAGLNYYYQLLVEANPETLDYDIYDVLTFKVEDKDKDILTVDEYGYVKGLKKGTATVTVAYDIAKINALIEEYGEDVPELKELREKYADLASKTKTVTFDVRPLFTQGMPEAHAITNIHKTLKDVPISGDSWTGWTWRDPETPLYSLPDSGNAYYEFEAEYTGTEYYEYEGSVKVYISTITGVNVTNNNSNVISADGNDSMSLIVKPAIYGYTGLTEDVDYKVEFPQVQNITITPEETGYKVTASKKGKYTLKPEIKIGGTTVATGNYTVVAVDGKLIDHIDIEPVVENKNVTIKGSQIYFDSNAGVDSFKLKATAYDREGNVSTDAKLVWTITDKTVADIDTKTGGDRDVTVKVKGDGHALIQVTAGDAAKATSKFRLEARNRKPRVEGDKISINTAYDYQTGDGIWLSAAQGGKISVATVYGEDIDSVQVVSADVEDGAKDLNGKILSEFEAYHYDEFWADSEEEGDWTFSCEYYYVIRPTNADMGAGKHNVKLAVTTASGFIYTYPLTITVINKQPKVSAKVSNAMNLFYLNEKGYLDITLEKNKSKDTDYAIQSLTWSKNASDGFKFSYTGSYITKTPNVKRCYIDGSKVKVDAKGKLTNQDIANGTVTIKLAGVRNSYELPIKIKYSYKKPKLTTSDSMTKKNTSTIVSSTGAKSGGFSILADKTNLYYYTNYYENVRYYTQRRCDNDQVTISGTGANISFTYSGTQTQFEIPLTLDSYNWREALKVTHKVKDVKPTVVLSNAKLLYNTTYDGEVSTRVYLKDYYGYPISAVDVAGADTASQELLTSNKLQIKDIGGGWITAKLNASRLGSQVPKGASYVLTPYYSDPATGENKPLKAVTLKISFTNKPVTAKISGKGKLDLAICDKNYDSYDYYRITGEDSYSRLTTNSIAVTAKFANLSSGYYVTDAKLTGEYSKYFTLYGYYYDYSSNPALYIKISDKGVGKLKAGQTYNLSVTYTLEDEDGNQITVKSSNALKVKPIQKAPKLTVVGDNQILYAASSSLYKRCEVRTPYYNTRLEKDYYRVQSAYGFLDTNKDGKPDIEAKLDREYSDSSEGYISLKVQLTDEDAVATTAKGKSYTIPVTVKLVGRDGISKDAVVKVKVIVKR